MKATDEDYRSMDYAFLTVCLAATISSVFDHSCPITLFKGEALVRNNTY